VIWPKYPSHPGLASPSCASAAEAKPANTAKPKSPPVTLDEDVRIGFLKS
jgi:hypothetical protein